MSFFGCDYLETNGSIFTEYRCKYSRRSLDSRTATDICMSSRYLECEDYKNATRCFITTAVCLTMGKSDRCEELTAMRRFRDEWLRNQPDGPELIEDYYQTAPAIVENINRRPDRESIYSEIYKSYILPCVKCVEAERFGEGRQIYLELVDTMKRQYCR